MKIAFISLMAGLPWGGSESLWHSTAKHAVVHENEVLVSVYDWGKLPEKIKELEDLGCKIDVRPLLARNQSFFKKGCYSLRNKFFGNGRFYPNLVNFKPEIVVINQGGTFDISVHHYSLYNLLVQRNIPYILISHSQSQFSDIPPSSVFPRAIPIFKSASFNLFVSKRMIEYAERQLCTTLENARQTWNPLNVDDHAYLEWPKGEEVQMAVVGGLLGSKGPDMIFAALSSEKWKGREWKLNVYGSGEGEDYLKALSNYYGTSEKIKFHGHVNSIKEVWRKNHLLVIGSASEGMPISLVEAMICGRPVVATDVGGISELVKEGETGFIAESPYTAYLECALERAWRKKDTWPAMGIAARKNSLEIVDLVPEVSLYNLIVKNVEGSFS